MNLKISATELKNNFIDSFKNEKSFKYDDGNPFLITFEKKEFYVFLKNISPAYYPKYPDITRIQLPYSPHFREISKSNSPFIILGFNAEYGTFTGWDPSKIKNRLNNKSNVSLFSRNSFQEKLRLNNFKEHHISNGDKVILFSIKSTPIYFKSVKSLFGITKDKVKEIAKNQLTFNLFDFKEKPEVIENKVLLKKIKLLIKNDKILEAVNICALHYQDDYPKMELKDWFVIVEKYIQ
jgi:hypothetical protein